MAQMVRSPMVVAGPALGHFGRRAGATMTFEWTPDPGPIADTILAVDSYFMNRRMPMALAGQIVRGDVRERFRQQNEPDGTPWEPWAESYAPLAQRINKGKILEQTLALRNAATSPGVVRATNNSVFYQTGSLPFYWIFHQVGAVRRSGGDIEREIAGIASGLGVSHARARTIAMEEGTGVNVLPRRSFLGLSRMGQEQIMEIFDDWFTGAIKLYDTSTGKVGIRHAVRGKTTAKSTAGSFAPR